VQRCVEPESPRVATKPSAITDQPAALEPTGLRSPWNVDSGSASAPTVAEAGMADEPAVVAGAGITEECVDASGRLAQC
jgi:hypothetical protein